MKKLLQILADQHNGAIPVAQVEEALVHEAGGGHIQAAGRLGGQHQRQIPASSRASSAFCRFPPDNVPVATWLPAALIPKLSIC